MYLRMRVKGVDVEVDSMQCRAWRVSGVASALALGSGEFVAASSLRWLRCERRMQRGKREEEEGQPPTLPYL